MKVSGAMVAWWLRYRTRGQHVMSSNLLRLKTRNTEIAKTRQYVEVKCLSFGVVWKFGEAVHLRRRPRHLTMVQNDKVRRQKHPSS
ncbi:hypothetical protein TNCV_1446501 [Trichonephila clavipes]|nr:hypothetical protein TNCV_1446501 [Trichonephila clavipes]